MGKTIRMDSAGRIVIPQAVRERYGLLGGVRLEVRESAEGIVLRPQPEEIPAERHSSGWVVFHSGEEEEDSDPVQAVEEERERRHRQIRGDA